MNNFNYKFCRGAAVLLMATSLSGCGMWSRLQQVGQEPPLAPITNPVEAKNYEPVSMPMPQVNDAKGGANSLWKPGSSGFSKICGLLRLATSLRLKFRPRTML